MSTRHAPAPNDLRAFWMPFTANRQFKAAPRMFVAAEGMRYTTSDGRQVLDGTAGLWCCNAGHCRPRITAAIAEQAAEMDYAPAFQMGHPKAFELANRLIGIAPEGMEHVFFTNSGSESVETALKIAIAYHRAKGEGARTRLIGRERGYHGVNFGGISVGGIVSNRKVFGTLLGGVDHLPHTHLPAKNAFSKGQPEHGAELADELERIVALHDASTIAAVIVEPVAGSTGVLIPPKGYLERLREILQQARHPADLRRGDHRLRADRRGVRGRQVRGAARHDHLRQGADQRGDPDGGGADERRDPRRLHDRARAHDRALPRLHLLGQPDRGGGGARHARGLRRGGAVRAGGAAGAGLGRRRCIRCATARTSSTSATRG